jgi:hypothetical protein
MEWEPREREFRILATGCRGSVEDNTDQILNVGTIGLSRNIRLLLKRLM